MMKLSKLSFAVVCVVSACTGEQGETGAQGAQGAGVVIATEPEAAGANCENGGIKLSYGIDDNGNGTLDAGEVDGSSYVCNGGSGEAGHDTLVTTSPEAAGANCAAGGLEVDHGVDDNGNGTLDAGEVDGTDYVCAPSASLVATTPEPAGTNCTAGGTKITSGLDDNANGTLDAGEVDSTRYACNGNDGLRSLVRTSAEPIGANCGAGGTRIDYGIDDSNNGTLEAGEIDGTSYVCEPGALFDSLTGQTFPTQRTSGDACGTRVNVAGGVIVRKIFGMTNMASAGNVKFVIFNHNANDSIVYQSAPKAFPADSAASWKGSDNLGVALSAGGSYCIVMTTDVPATYMVDAVSETAAGLTSTTTNPNLGSFATPTVLSHANADCGIRLVTY